MIICTNDPRVFYTDLLIWNSESGEMYFAREVWPEARIPMVPVDGHRHKHLSKKRVKFFLNYCLCLNETETPFQTLDNSWPQLYQIRILLLSFCTFHLIFQFQLFQHNHTGRGVKVVIFSWAGHIFKIILMVCFSNIKLALYLWWKASRYRQIPLLQLKVFCSNSVQFFGGGFAKHQLFFCVECKGLKWKTHPWYCTHVILWYLQYPSNLESVFFMITAMFTYSFVWI